MTNNLVPVRIKKIDGAIIQTKGFITDCIDNNGRQFCTATVRKKSYDVVDRDYYGPIFGKKKLD